MRFFYQILFTFTLFFGQDLWASSFSIDSIKVKCFSNYGCTELDEVFSSLKRNYSSMDHFYTVIKLYVASEGIKEMDFEIKKSSSQTHLAINVKLKQKILEVEDPIFDKGEFVEFPSVLPVRPGEYIDNKRIEETVKIFKDIAREKGFPLAVVNLEKIELKKGVVFKFKISLKRPTVVSDITVTTKSKFLQNMKSTLI